MIKEPAIIANQFGLGIFTINDIKMNNEKA